MSMISISQALVAVSIVVALQRFAAWRKRTACLPPGPRGWPIIGNVLDWPSNNEYLTFSEWGRKYGPVTYLEVAGTSYVVLNSAEACKELLDRRGMKYAGRPRRQMFDLSDIKADLNSAEYGPRAKIIRRLLMQELGTNANIARFAPTIEYRARRFVRWMVEDGVEDSLRAQLFRYTTSLILKINFGYETEDMKDDPFVALAHNSVRAFAVLLEPTIWLVDILPISRYLPSWIPGIHFHTVAKRVGKQMKEFRDVPIEWLRNEMKAGRAKPSFTANHFNNPIISPEDEELVRYASEAIYIAGSDTTASTLRSFFLNMILYPDVQARAQAEIDSVIGHNQLPTLADRDRLPFVNALVKEVLRINALVAIGLPHRVVEDDVYNGSLIPKGTVVFANIWQILRDPEIYKDPETFNPSRFLGDTPEQNPIDFAFGFGRRICPGKFLAAATVFVTISTVLALVNIEPAEDERGRPIEPKPNFVFRGLVRSPEDFPCKLVPRSAEAKALACSALFTNEE